VSFGIEWRNRWLTLLDTALYAKYLFVLADIPAGVEPSTFHRRALYGQGFNPP